MQKLADVDVPLPKSPLPTTKQRPEPSAKSTANKYHEARMQRLWAVLTRCYSYTFTNAQGVEPNRDWIAKLADLTDEEFAAGIEAAENDPSDFAPGYKKFRQWCRPKVMPYHRQYEALPAPTDKIGYEESVRAEVERLGIEPRRDGESLLDFTTRLQEAQEAAA